MKVFLSTLSSRPEFFNGGGWEQVPFALESFHYFQDWEAPIIAKGDDFMLDSGAFTYMHDTSKKVDWWEYAERYAEFIVRHDVKNYVELDLDNIIGYSEVLKIRAFLERETNRPCMPVWHLWRGEDEYLRMVDEYDYACISGFVSNVGGGGLSGKAKMVPHLIREGHKRGCRLHGLGCTRTKQLHALHFDSVDSTAWLSGGRYGQLHVFNGRDITTLRKPKGMRAKDYRQIDAHNLREWLKFVRYAERNL